MIQYSIGELIDKLCITNLKQWHTEEEIKELREQNANSEELLPLCNLVVKLNKLRNELVKSIDEFFQNHE
jgi:hypothetical protein